MTTKMPIRVKDLTGVVAGPLRVIRFVGIGPGRHAKWMVHCRLCDQNIEYDAGTLARRIKNPSISNLCRHNPVPSRLRPGRRTWEGIRDRCHNVKCPDWPRYGGRGIRVCERWWESFDAFWRDVGETWAPGLQLDRIDNDGDYAPGNVRWTTSKQNNRNRSNNRRVRGKTISEWAEETGIGKATIRYRLDQGASFDQLFRKPDRARRLS